MNLLFIEAGDTDQMNAKRSLLLSALPIGAVAAAFYLAGCGGSGSSDNAASYSAGSGATPQTSAATPIVVPDSTQPPLAMPSNIANGSIVELECGRVYRGTLDLSNKSNITVRTAGDCGKAVLTPGQAITGWTQYQGNVYSAPISFDAAQVLIDGQPISLAHWPNQPQTWVKSSGASANSLSYAMTNADLPGATDFYVEGKLWMLDAPGEWAVNGGRLYVWTPDGQSPEGRAWASPDQHAIEASDSSGISIDGISVFGAANGINELGASYLHVSNTDIVNSSENGIENAGGSGLYVDGAGIL